MKSIVKAAVLCGGEGRRLRPLTNYFQKTMIPIGHARRPLLEYVVRLLVHNGVSDITMLNGYRAEEIENYFGDGSRFGARINYSRDAAHTKGSAGAVANAISRRKIDGDMESLIIYYGDILSDLNISKLIEARRESGADATLVLAKGFTLPVGVAKVDDSSIVTSLIEKPTLDIEVTTGNMIINSKALRLLKEVASNESSTDLMRDFVPKLLEKGRKVSAFYVDGFWYDVGTVEKYQNLSNSIVEKHLGFLE